MYQSKNFHNHNYLVLKLIYLDRIQMRVRVAYKRQLTFYSFVYLVNKQE